MTLLKNLEGSIFFCLPVFWLLGLGMRGVCRRRSGTVFFIAFTVVLSLGYLPFAFQIDVSRYLMAPVLCLSLFVLPGLIRLGDWGVKGLRRCRYPALTRYAFILLAASVPVGVTVLKLSGAERKTFIGEFASVIAADIKSDPRDVLLLSLNAGDVVRIADRLPRKMVRCEVLSYSWQIAGTLSQYGGSHLGYFFAYCPMEQSVETFVEFFRGRNGIFPFDLLKEAEFRGRRYLLFRFNRRVGDGSTISPSRVFSRIPGEVALPKTAKTQVFTIDFGKLLPASVIDGGGFVELECFPWFSVTRFWQCDIRCRANVFPSDLLLKFYNKWFWPEVLTWRKVVPLDSSAAPRAVTAPAADDADWRLPASPEPLLLEPRVVAVDCANPVIYLSNFNPFRGNGHEYVFKQKNNDGWNYLPDGVLRIEHSGKVDLKAEDRETGSAKLFEMEVRVGDADALRRVSSRILFLTDRTSSQWKTADHVRKMLKNGSRVDEICVGNGFPPELTLEDPAYFDHYLSKINTGSKGYDLVAVQLFVDRAFRYWERGQFEPMFMRTALSRLRQAVGTYAGNAGIVVFLPPAPVPGSVIAPPDWRYRQLPLLHYAVCSQLERALTEKAFSDINYASLCHVPNANCDYQLAQWRTMRLPTGPYDLSDAGKKKLAAVVGAVLANLSKRVVSEKGNAGANGLDR